MVRLSIPDTPTRLTFTLNDFSGGLVNNVNDVKMLDNQSPDMLNMQFRNDGLLQKRPGIIHFLNTKDGDMLIDCIPYEYAPDLYLMIFVAPYHAYYIGFDGEPVLFWVHPIIKVPATETDDEGNEVPNFAHKGVDFSLKYVHYNGSLLFTEGDFVYEFTYNPEDALPKIYKYVNAPKNYTPEPKPAVTGKTKTKFIEKFTYPYEPSWKCGELYEKWYEPCEFEREDGYKGLGLLPPTIGFMAIHKDRLYLSGSEYDPNMIWISDILNPCYFPASLTIQTPPTDDYITALHTYNDALIIGRRDSIYALFGNTNRTDSDYQYNLVKLNTHTGIANNNCVNNVYHMLFFVGTDGNMYKLLPPGISSDSIYTKQVNTLLDITLPPLNLSPYIVSLCESCFDGKEGLWYIQLGDETLVYNYTLMAWTRYRNINALNFFIFNNEVYFVRCGGGVYKLPGKNANQSYFDEVYDGDAGRVLKLPVNAYWTSRNMDFGVPARVKQFRDTYVTTESFEDHPTKVNVKYEVDYVDIYESYLVENEIAKWDKAIFDKSKFTSRNIDRSLPLMINRRGRTIKVYYGSGYKYLGVWMEVPEPGSVEEYNIIYSREDDALFLRVPYREGFETKKDKYYINLSELEIDDALLVHNITGVYELKGYR